MFVDKLNVTGLGHVRLSIIDLSPSGNQPFHDEEGRIHAVVNGELYDYERYKAQLSDEFKFVGNSDSEIVIALYKHYGLSFISHLRGEFAFVLWDENRQQVARVVRRLGNAQRDGSRTDLPGREVLRDHRRAVERPADHHRQGSVAGCPFG